MNSPEYAFTNMTSLKSGKIAFVFSSIIGHFVFCFTKRTHFIPSASSASTGLGRNGSRVSLHIYYQPWNRKFKMADSESDEDNDWKKGEKRRQDSSNEDSDEDSYSEDDADTSDESFDENMVSLYSCFNHQLLCCTCNLSKNKKHVIVWYVPFLGHLIGDSCWIWSLSANRRRFQWDTMSFATGGMNFFYDH